MIRFLDIDNEKEEPDWKLFVVTWTVDSLGYQKIWAKDAEHAKGIAADIGMCATSENTEIAEAMDIVEVKELDDE